MTEFLVSMVRGSRYGPHRCLVLFHRRNLRDDWTAISLVIWGRGIAAKGKNLALEEEQDGGRRRKSQMSPTASSDEPRRKNSRTKPPEVGAALRAAYQRTVQEQIPAEMLDLLGKLD
jgi:hypothetical protein